MGKIRRVTVLFVVLATLLLAVPASAAECGPVRGVATLQVFDTTTAPFAEGVAVVRFGGEWQVVPITEPSFTSTPGGLVIEQEWSFDEGTVTFQETSNPVDIPGTNLQRFVSPVTVIAGGSGSVTYRGIFDTDAMVAVFRVRGTICIGA